MDYWIELIIKLSAAAFAVWAIRHIIIHYPLRKTDQQEGKTNE